MPGDPHVQSSHGSALVALGQVDEAIEAARLASELDPRSTAALKTLGDWLYYDEQYAKSIEVSHRILAMEPGDWYAHYNLGWVHTAQGRWREGVAALREAEARTVESRPTVYAAMAYAFARGQQRDSALTYLERGKETSLYDHALIWHELGDHVAGVAALEEILTTAPSLVPWLRSDPIADEMLADERYADVIRRLGL